MITSHARREKRAINKATAKITGLKANALGLFYLPSRKHSTASRCNGGREREGGKTQARKGTERQEESTRKSIQSKRKEIQGKNRKERKRKEMNGKGEREKVKSDNPIEIAVKIYPLPLLHFMHKAYK